MVELSEPATPAELRVLARLGLEPTPKLLATLRQLIVSVAANKGGVGKTELSKELAWVYDGVLVDLDYDAGGITRKWGYFHENRANAPLIDALSSGRTPRPLSGGSTKADLVPSHPDFAYPENQPTTEALTIALEKWQREWGRPVVTDNHPGGSDVTYGSMAAANVVVVPQPIGYNEIQALEGMLRELRDYSLMIIPNQNLGRELPAEWLVQQMEDLSAKYGVPVGPSVSYNYNLRSRKLRMAVLASDPMPIRYELFAEEMTNVARAVLLYAAERMENY